MQQEHIYHPKHNRHTNLSGEYVTVLIRGSICSKVAYTAPDGKVTTFAAFRSELTPVTVGQPE